MSHRTRRLLIGILLVLLVLLVGFCLYAFLFYDVRAPRFPTPTITDTPPPSPPPTDSPNETNTPSPTLTPSQAPTETPIPTDTPTSPPLSDDATSDDEVLCETVWPVLYEVDSSRVLPGSELQIKGHSGYIECTDGFINESSRDFILMLDQVEIGSINCYVNGCRGTIRLSDDILPGTHTFTSEGGSEIAFEVLGE